MVQPYNQCNQYVGQGLTQVAEQECAILFLKTLN